jgi:N6-adenosine-specific RNA methylase IME4
MTASPFRLWARTWPRDTTFEVLVVDPPWPYAGRGFRSAAPYESMTLAELHAMPVYELAATDCALLLWTTGPFLPHALELMHSWGFTYKTVFLDWHKVNRIRGTSRLGLGFYTRSCHEFLLLGTRGHALRWRRSRTVSQHVVAPVERHSQKPEAAWRAIETFFDESTRKMELFSRQTRAGWWCWGKEVCDEEAA